MTQQDPRNFTFSSDYPMAYFVFDKVVSVTVPAAGDYVASETITVPHNLGFEILPVGYWSTDPEFKSTNDIGIEALGGDFKSVIVIADSTNFYVTGRNGGSSPTTLYVHIWAYMAPGANGNAPAVSDSTNFNFDTDYSYLEIFKSGVVEPYSSQDPVEIYHNLGYTPYCRIWRDTDYGGNQGIAPFTESQYNTGVVAETVLVDTEKLYLDRPSSWSRRFYHIYTAEVQTP